MAKHHKSYVDFIYNIVEENNKSGDVNGKPDRKQEQPIK